MGDRIHFCLPAVSWTGPIHDRLADLLLMAVSLQVLLPVLYKLLIVQLCIVVQTSTLGRVNLLCLCPAACPHSKHSHSHLQAVCCISSIMNGWLTCC